MVSGIGLANVYEFFCATMPDKVNPEVKKAVDTAGDMKGAVIAQHKEDELCVKTMEVFMAAYGAETGVVALKWLPYGGLYLTGGMTPKNIGDPPSLPCTLSLSPPHAHSHVTLSNPSYLLFTVIRSNKRSRRAFYVCSIR